MKSLQNYTRQRLIEIAKITAEIDRNIFIDDRTNQELYSTIEKFIDSYFGKEENGLFLGLMHIMAYCKKDSKSGMVNIFNNNNYHPVNQDELIFLNDRSYVDSHIQIIFSILETDHSKPIFHISHEEDGKNLVLESNTHLGFIAPRLRSITELATSYAHDLDSLSEEEIYRLKRKGSGTVRDYLLLHLPPSDPIVKAITERLTIPLINGYSIIL